MRVWTNGCFDILHRGHIELFKYASLLGDELVITDNEEVVRLDIVDNSETMLKLNGAIDASDFESLQEEGLTVSESSIEIVLVK